MSFSRQRLPFALSERWSIPALAAALLLGAPCAALAATSTPTRAGGTSSMVCKRSGCAAMYTPPAGAVRNNTASRWSIGSSAAPAGFGPLSTDFTWTGATPQGSGASNWSLGSNWGGGVAPSGSVGTLTFPILTSPACASNPPADTCYTSFNNIAGLIANAISIDEGASRYFLRGDAIELGIGGLSAGTSVTSGSSVGWGIPLVLQAPQTWTIDGNNDGSQLGLGANVSGSSEALTIDLNHQTFLNLNSINVEVGPITIDTTQTTGFNTSSVTLTTGSGLNSTDGNSVSLMGSGTGGTGIFAAGNAAVGALTADAGRIQIGNGSQGAAKLSVNGGFTQGAADTLALNVIKPGTAAGADYSQLSATGPISLGGNLQLNGITTGLSPMCPTLHVGDVDTLLTSTGALTGAFTGIPNGKAVGVGCGPGVPPTGRINYTANSVTFTVLTTGGAPTVGGVAPNAGSTAGGNTVVIGGTNFVRTSTVHFGSVASPKVTFVSSTELKAVAPAEASGVVHITVTSGGATSAKSGRDLYAYGAPTVTSFTPTSGPVGTVVTVMGTNFVPRATVKFATVAATSVTYVSPTEIKATVPTGAVTGPISVSTPAGTGTSASNFTVT